MAIGVAETQAAIARAFSAPFEVGRHDCCVAIADAIVLLGGPDIADGWRGYSEEEARRLQERAGGLVPLLRGVCLANGMRAVSEPLPGCVGITEGRPAAIYDGHRWWAKGRRGMVAVASPEHMWRWDHG